MLSLDLFIAPRSPHYGWKNSPLAVDHDIFESGQHRRPILSDTVEVFDFDIDTDGARVVVRLHPICPGCRTDREVDANIKLLKEDLDAVAGRMKAALQVQAHKSLTG